MLLIFSLLIWQIASSLRGFIAPFLPLPLLELLKCIPSVKVSVLSNVKASAHAPHRCKLRTHLRCLNLLHCCKSCNTCPVSAVTACSSAGCNLMGLWPEINNVGIRTAMLKDKNVFTILQASCSAHA